MALEIIDAIRIFDDNHPLAQKLHNKIYNGSSNGASNNGTSKL
jgi:hypothetical protein